jgi:hypothetical protein
MGIVPVPGDVGIMPIVDVMGVGIGAGVGATVTAWWWRWWT